MTRLFRKIPSRGTSQEEHGWLPRNIFLISHVIVSPSSSHSPKGKQRKVIHCVGNTKQHDALVDATQHDSHVYSSRHYLKVSVREFRYGPTVFNHVATRARRIFHQKVNIIFPRVLLSFFSSADPLLSWLLSHKATLWLGLLYHDVLRLKESFGRS